MSRTLTRSLVAAVALATPFYALSAGTAKISAKSTLSAALADGASQKSVTLSGTVSGSGTTITLDGGFSPAGNGGLTTVPKVGTYYAISPRGKKYCFVKATSVAMLKQALYVKSPNTDEINLWYKVTSKDPRYDSIASPNGAQTVSQLFSFTPAGWSRKATYKATTTLNGVRVIKLKAASNLFVSGKGFATTTLYVTEGKNPLPFAMSGPTGTTGLFYFTKWGTTTVAIPFTDIILPK